MTLKLGFGRPHDLIHCLGNASVIVPLAALGADVRGDILDQDIATFSLSHDVDILGSHLPIAKVAIEDWFTHGLAPSGLAYADRATWVVMGCTL